MFAVKKRKDMLLSFLEHFVYNAPECEQKTRSAYDPKNKQH